MFRTALLAFFCSRALVFALLVFGSQLAFLQKVNSNSVWETRVELQQSRLWLELSRSGRARVLSDQLLRLDAAAGIAGLVPMGTFAFVMYLHRLTGDWLAFLHVQKNWGRAPGFFWTPIVDFLAHPARVSEPWNFIALNFAMALLLAIASIVLMRQKRWELAAYTLASLLLPLSTGSLQSLARRCSRCARLRARVITTPSRLRRASRRSRSRSRGACWLRGL